MTVKFVTHTLQTGEITIDGHVTDTVTMQGVKISRVGAIEGQEQKNPAAIHINFETKDSAKEMLLLRLGVPDAIELGLQLVAMGIEDHRAPAVDEIRDRLAQLVAELDRTLQVSR